MAYAYVHCCCGFIGGRVGDEETCEFVGELDEFVFSVVLLADFDGQIWIQALVGCGHD